MASFTGPVRPTIAGIGCALAILLASHLAWADTAAAGAQASSPAAAIADTAVAPVYQAPNPAGVKANNPAPKSNSAAQLANLVGGLALILVLIYGLSWFVKRFSQGGFMQNPAMKILATMPLGTRERLMLVEVGGQQLLLGVTATAINTLHVFTEPVILAGEKSPQPAAQRATSEFSQKLMAILQQKNIPDAGDNSHKNANS